MKLMCFRCLLTLIIAVIIEAFANISHNDTYQRFFESVNDHEKHLTAIIHSGPHKTGTTHIQNYLANSLSALGSIGYAFPSGMESKAIPGHYTVNPLVQREYVKELRGEVQDHELHDFLQNSIDEEQNVILSSENFIELKYDELLKLKKALNGFDKKIVILVYRDQLTRARSRRYEHSEHLFMKEAPLLPWLHTYFNQLIDEFITSMDAHIDIFGKENVHLIDYEGVLAAHKDEVYVIFCEVIGILCDETKELNTHQDAYRANSSPSITGMIPRMVLDYMERKSYSRGCGYFLINRSFRYMQILENEISELKMNLPLKSVSLDYFMNVTRVDEANVRHKYKDIMIYANPDANEAARQSISHQEIDFDTMEADKSWRKWLNKIEVLFELDKCVGSTPTYSA